MTTTTPGAVALTSIPCCCFSPGATTRFSHLRGRASPAGGPAAVRGSPGCTRPPALTGHSLSIKKRKGEKKREHGKERIRKWKKEGEGVEREKRGKRRKDGKKGEKIKKRGRKRKESGEKGAGMGSERGERVGNLFLSMRGKALKGKGVEG